MPKLCHGYCSETEMQSLSDVSTLTIIVWFTFINYFQRIYLLYVLRLFLFIKEYSVSELLLSVDTLEMDFRRSGYKNRKKGENRWII